MPPYPLRIISVMVASLTVTTVLMSFESVFIAFAMALTLPVALGLTIWAMVQWGKQDRLGKMLGFVAAGMIAALGLIFVAGALHYTCAGPKELDVTSSQKGDSRLLRDLGVESTGITVLRAAIGRGDDAPTYYMLRVPPGAVTRIRDEITAAALKKGWKMQNGPNGKQIAHGGAPGWFKAPDVQHLERLYVDRYFFGFCAPDDLILMQID